MCWSIQPVRRGSRILGIAATAEQLGKLTNAEACVGTLDYMSPEQRHRLPVDERADQYALAFMAYEMLTGRQPLGITTEPSRHNPDLTHDVDKIILRGLEEDPDDRFPNVAAFTNALTRRLAEAPTTGADGGGLRRWSRLVLPGLIVLLCAVAGTAIWRGYAGYAPPNIAVADALNRSVEPPRAGTDDPDTSTAASMNPPGGGKSSRTPLTTEESASDSDASIELTGVLAYRRQEGGIEILLLRSRLGTQWTIPKGRQKQRSTLETVTKEAFHDGGVRGTALASPVGVYFYRRSGRRYRVTVFPLFVDEEFSTWPKQSDERKWCSPTQAAELVSAKALPALLRNFDPNDL